MKDPYWIEEILRWQIDPSEFVKQNAEEPFLKSFAISLDRREDRFILQGFHYLKELFDSANSHLERVENVWRIEVDGLIFEIRTFEELYVLNEVFVAGTYNILPSRPVVVIDVGMNVGFSSIFFANNPFVRKVYAFEPVRMTFEHALRNLSLNVHCFNKIEPANFGLSNIDGSIEIDFNEEYKASAGINPLRAREGTDITKIRRELIQIRKADVVLGEIVSSWPETPLFLKLDCEGSEYAIIEALQSGKILEKFDFVMLEWHDASRLAELQQAFRVSGFSVLSLTPKNLSTGMFYGFRSDGSE